MPSPIRKAVIPAAGLGTRFLPATRAVPKELLPIVDVPALQLVVEEALASGIEEIILVTGRGKHAMEDHFDDCYELEHTLRARGKVDLAAQMARISRMVRLVSVRQKEPLGLGHAVLCAREAANGEPVAVLLGDDLFDAGRGRPAIGQMLDVYASNPSGGAVISLLEVEPGQEQMYGIARARAIEGGRYQIDDLVEKPAPGTAPSRLAVMGRYVLPSEIWEVLARTPAGKNGEVQLTDALRTLAHEGRCVGIAVSGEHHDTGDRLGYLGACLSYALQRPELRPGLLQVMQRLIQRHASDG